MNYHKDCGRTTPLREVNWRKTVPLSFFLALKQWYPLRLESLPTERKTSIFSKTKKASGKRKSWPAGRGSWAG